MNLNDWVQIQPCGELSKSGFAVIFNKRTLAIMGEHQDAEAYAGEVRDGIARAIDVAVRERINTPEIEDFMSAVKIEAAHQGARWVRHDGKKTIANWAGLFGWLIGKALSDEHELDDVRSPRERLLHRIVALAAAASRWHQEEIGRAS